MKINIKIHGKERGFLLFVFLTKIKFFHNIFLWGGDTSNKIFEGISWIAESGILFITIGLALFLFKRTRKTGLAILLAVGLGFLTTNLLLKNIIQRVRPFNDVSSDFYMWWLDAGASKASGFSFPSGHTTATTAFSVAILLTSNKDRSWSILFLPLLMACSRIYLMVHYFSDCVGGLVVGAVVATLAYFIVKQIYKGKNKACKFIQNFSIIGKDDNSSQSAATSNVMEDFVYTPQNMEENSSAENSESTNSNSNHEND